MKKRTDLFFYSSFFISLCAFGLVWQTYLLTGLQFSLPVAFLLFFATLFLYNLDNLLPYKTGQQMVLSDRKKWLLVHRKMLQGLVLISGAAALGLFLWLLPEIPLWFILPLFLVSVLYSLPVLPGKKGRFPLRDVPLLKVFLVALVWSGLTVGLPLLVAGQELTQPYYAGLLLRRFLFIFALTLLFDIRDFRKDRLTQTVTFPGLFGNVFTRLLSAAALLFFGLLVYQQETGLTQLALLISAAISGVVVYLSREDRPDIFFSVFADGMMLLQFLLVWLAII